MTRVVVIGGGLSGLAAAYRILQRHPHVELTLLEDRTRPGGNIWTTHEQGYTLEQGPNGIFDQKPHTLRLCRDLGLGEQLIVASEGSRKNRYLYLNNHLLRLPGDPLGLLRTQALSFSGKLSLLAEPFRRRRGNLPPDESIAEFARRRFGREAADVFIDALVTGIHAGDPEQLSVAAAFPRLVNFEKSAGSVVRGALRAAKHRKQEMLARGETPHPQRMWSFRGGLKVLIDGLTEALGARVKLGVTVRSLRKQGNQWYVVGAGQEAWQADVVVNTAPAYAMAEQLQDEAPALSEELAGIGFNAIAVVLLGYRQTDAPHQPDGFGYIAPQNTRRDVLGVQWCSSIFPGRAPDGCVLWRALCGGVHRSEMATLPDQDLIRRVHKEMRQTMQVRGEPVFTQVVRWPKAIPQYRVGHLARLERIHQLLKKQPGLILGGNSLYGVAMNDCCEQAERIAESLTSA